MFKALESMNTMEMPMSDEDMPDEGMFESCMEIHEDHPELAELSEMCTTMDDLTHLHGVVESFGVSKNMMAFANKDGILSAVMPAFAACEALEGDAAAGSPEADHAKQSVLDKIKEVSAAWFKKAWDLASGWGAKIGSFAKAAYEKVEMYAKWAAGKTFDAAKAVKENILAHPVAWVVSAAAAATAVTAVIVGLWTGTLPTDAESYKKWAMDAQASITEAFKKGGAAVMDTATSVGHSAVDGVKAAGSYVADHASSAAAAVKSGTAAALGYTKEGFDHAIAAVKGLYADGGPISKLGNFFKEGAMKIFEAVKEHGAAGVAWTKKAISWLMTQTWHLWSKAPATAMKYFTKAMSVFKGLFTKSTVAA